MTAFAELLILATLAAGASALLTGLVRAYALRKRLLDTPNSRSSHSAPTPRGGGLAVVAIAATGMMVSAFLGLADDRVALTVVAGMLVLAVVGWIDDKRGLDARVRILIQAAVAGSTVIVFHGLPSVQTGTGSIELGVAGYVLSGLGIVWSINLFNFMDGIDGLAGSQAVLIFGAVALLSIAGGTPGLAPVAAVTASAALGFLLWNWPPARIFLGDVGSGPLGYLIAALAIASENSGGLPVIAFAILGSVFVVDATVTLLRRLAHGHGPTHAHREHAYQRLARTWGGHRPATLVAGGLTVCFGGLAAFATARSAFLLPALVFAWSLLGALLVVAERHAPMRARLAPGVPKVVGGLSEHGIDRSDG